MMWVLLLVSIFGLAIFLERTFFLHRGQIRTADFLEGIRNLVSKGRKLEALTLCEDIPGPIPGLVKAILIRSEDGHHAMRAAAEEAAMVEVPILERRIGALAAVARIAPLLGLLGTVLGLIRAFFDLALGQGAGFATFNQLMLGMGQALLTTAFGLVIAVMAHIAHHFLYGRVKALIHDMEYTGHDLIQFFTGLSQGGKSTSGLASDGTVTVAMAETTGEEGK